MPTTAITAAEAEIEDLKSALHEANEDLEDAMLQKDLDKDARRIYMGFAALVNAGFTDEQAMAIMLNREV